MNIEKFKKLKEEIRNKSFEKKYNGVDNILYVASFFGNIASIFFAFFLWYPSLLKTITLHVSDNGLTHAIAIGTTILLLSLIEFLKRGVLGIFSSEFIEANMKFKEKSVIGLFIFSSLILGLSLYFSINGAVEFSKTSSKINIQVEKSSSILIDSLTKLNETHKQPINDELTSLRESNKDLRNKRDDTPIEQRRVRTEYNQLILENEKLIEANTKKLNDLNLELTSKINDLNKNVKENQIKNEASDKTNVTLFLIVSSFIEIIIVIGVFFRQLFIHNSFYESEAKYDPIVRKREKYEKLLSIVYKNGEVKQDDQVISLPKLIDMVKNKGVSFTAKHVEDFYLELGHLGAFKVVSSKRYAMVSYENAKKLLDNIENL